MFTDNNDAKTLENKTLPATPIQKRSDALAGAATLAMPNPIRSTHSNVGGGVVASTPPTNSDDLAKKSVEEDVPEPDLEQTEQALADTQDLGRTSDEAVSPKDATPASSDELRVHSSAFGDFFRNLLLLLFRPTHFWETQRSKPVSLLHLHWPHLVLLIALRAIAQLIGGLINPAISWSTAVVHATTSFLFLFFFVWLFAMIVAGITAVSEADCHVSDTIRYTAYSITPLFFIGFLAIIPVPHLQPIADAIAMPYTFYVMGTGASTFLRIPLKKSAALTGLMCGIMLCLWGLLPIYLPALLSSIFGGAPM
ncbi:MAG: Yip1 family protein [Bradymonadia bacterium]|jgi:hypothetical protein